MNKPTATKIVTKVNHLLGQFNELLCDIDGKVDNNEYQQYKKAVAKIMHISDQEIIKPIVDKFPDIDEYESTT